MKRGRGEHGNAVIDGKIYVIGGIFNSTTGPREVERFDPATGQWTIIDQFPVDRARHHFAIGSAVYGDQIWIVGGKTGNDITGKNWVDIYNTTTGQWQEGPDLPEIMWGGPTVIVGDTLHALAGAQGLNDTENFHFSLDLADPNATWQNKKKVPRPRVHPAGVAVDDKIYMIGGEVTHAHEGDTNTLQIYDTLTDTWSFGANVPLRRSHSEWATFEHHGEIWSVSGVNSANAPNRGQSEIFIYNPGLNEWREFTPELPVDLVSPGAKIIDETLYVYGGGENNWFDGDLKTTYAISIASVTSNGDINGNGIIEGNDFLQWQQSTPAGSLDQAALASWQANYGSAASTSQAVVVPEPQTLLLLGCWAAVLLTRKGPVGFSRSRRQSV